MKSRSVKNLSSFERQQRGKSNGRLLADEDPTEGASCQDPRCDPSVGGCREIFQERAKAKFAGSCETWTVWPDGGEFSGAPTPELIARVKETAPGRDVVNQQKWGRVRIIPNMKPGTELVAESSLERSFYLHLLLDPDVEELGGQPETLDLWVDDRRVRYTPDFWVSRKGVLFYVEIKPERMLAKRETVVKLQAAERLLGARGIRFVVITDKRIREDIPLRNAELVYRYRLCPLDLQMIARISDCFGDQRKVFSEVESALGGAEFRPYIMRAILAGLIGYAQRIPISEQSLIWWNGGR